MKDPTGSGGGECVQSEVEARDAQEGDILTNIIGRNDLEAAEAKKNPTHVPTHMQQWIRCPKNV